MGNRESLININFVVDSSDARADQSVHQRSLRSRLEGIERFRSIRELAGRQRRASVWQLGVERGALNSALDPSIKPGTAAGSILEVALSRPTRVVGFAPKGWVQRDHGMLSFDCKPSEVEVGGR